MSKSIKKQNNKRKKTKKRKDQLKRRNHIPENKKCSGRDLGWTAPINFMSL